MRILFVRHGEPNYEKDCLTETGKKQAAAAAKRLEGEGIAEIYASPCGRARETADFTASLLDLPVTTLPYMHEISWGGEDVPENGHPWTLSDWMITRENFDYSSCEWQEHPWFRTNKALTYYHLISQEIDAFLEKQGYRHDGRRFFCTAGNDKTIAIFSHGGSGACVLGHLLSLPFPYVCSVLPYDFTSIIILNFPDRAGEYVFPRLELFNDCAHIHTRKDGPMIQQRPDADLS